MSITRISCNSPRIGDAALYTNCNVSPDNQSVNCVHGIRQEVLTVHDNELRLFMG